MAFGTPVAGAAAYSAASGTSISVPYPAGITTGQPVLLFVGQKGSAINGGTVTTPTGWTLIGSIIGAGGYDALPTADTGDTNLFIYSKNTTGGETGNLAVTVGQNDVSWGFITRVPIGLDVTISYGFASGQQATAPTAGVSFAVALADGTPGPALQNGDLAIWAMCIPTDVTTPSQFSARSVTSTGATIGTATELNEPDSSNGNDIGGYSAYAFVTAGASSVSPTVNTTATGTVTNVRGPIALVRLREVPTGNQTLVPARFDNSNTFYAATVTRGTVTLTPARFNNTNNFFAATVTRTLTPALYTNPNSFFAATVTQEGGGQTLTPARFDNSNTFYAVTVTPGAVTLTPARFDNSNTFYAATVTRGTVTLTPALYTNPNSFFAATVTPGTVTLTPARFDNSNTFYSATVVRGTVTLTPTLYTNPNSFFAATVTPGAVTLTPARFDNSNAFYSATVTQEGGTQTLTPARFDNSNTFYSATVTRGTITLTPVRYDNPNSFFAATVVRGTVTLTPARFDNENIFYSATVAQSRTLFPELFNNINTFFDVVVEDPLFPALYTNPNTFYAALLRMGMPVPNWTPDGSASSSGFVPGTPPIPPDWTPVPGVVSNTFTPVPAATSSDFTPTQINANGV